MDQLTDRQTRICKKGLVHFRGPPTLFGELEHRQSQVDFQCMNKLNINIVHVRALRPLSLASASGGLLICIFAVILILQKSQLLGAILTEASSPPLTPGKCVFCAKRGAGDDVTAPVINTSRPSSVTRAGQSCRGESSLQWTF